MIGIGGHFKSDPSKFRISDIEISNNVFKNNHIGIDLVRGQKITIKDNHFENVDEPWVVNEESTRSIVTKDNEITGGETGINQVRR